MNERELVELDSDKNEFPTLFCQLNEFMFAKTGMEKWLERTRWIKFEEMVENTEEHWSKPHVGLLNFGVINEVRKSLEYGIISLDHPGSTLTEILDNVIDMSINMEMLDISAKECLMRILQIGHKRPKPKLKLSQRGSEMSLGRTNSETPNIVRRTGNPIELLPENNCDSNDNLLDTKFDSRFKKKIPTGSEVANILVAELSFLDRFVIMFMRLQNSLLIGCYSEVELPSKFVVIILGPPGDGMLLREFGRVIGSLLVDNVFRVSIYKAESKIDVLRGIDEFVNSALVIPPAEWNPEIRIHPPKEKIPIRLTENESGNRSQEVLEVVEEDDKLELVRTHRFCGGLIDDIKRKSKFYLSDFKDAFHIQCFATYAFLYFACLSPIITFGGLLTTATEGYLGAMESVIAGAIVGMVYALFAGQPLTILSSTGPILVFESIIFRLCLHFHWDFLCLRMWIGLWLMMYLLIMVAFDLSVLVKYITKFTEECFAMLIALIYIVEAFKNIFDLLDKFPVNRHWNPSHVLNRTCVCIPPNSSVLENLLNSNTERLLKLQKPPLLPSYNNFNLSILQFIDWNNISDGYFSWKSHEYREMCLAYAGIWEGNTCGKLYVPDVFFVSWILMIGTFGMAWGLKLFQGSRLFPNMVRQTIGNFAVVAAIGIFTLIDFLIGIETPKLIVPDKLEPTLGYNMRSWITPLLGRNPWWTIPLAAIPAMLAVILIFLDQQITTVIVNRKNNKLKKGYGYHLDLFVVAILIGINSVIGVPWFVAGTVLSMNHVMSLKKGSINNAPGENPTFLGCREQRLTHFMIFFTVGMSVFMTPVLRRIPMPVLYGVFLYMGISPLSEIEFIQRIGLFFMSAKNRPEIKYLRFIPIRRVHLFTLIELISLCALWAIKSVKVLSIGFPLMILATCFIRKSLDWVFHEEELKHLDQLFPPTKLKLPKSYSNCCKKRKHTERMEPLLVQMIPKILIDGSIVEEDSEDNKH